MTALLESVKQHIDSTGLVYDYEWRKDRLTTPDTEDAAKRVFIREEGEAGSDPILQGVNIGVYLLCDLADLESVGNTTADVVAYFRTGAVQPGVVRFDVVNGKTGPFEFPSGKLFFQFSITAFVEDR